MDRLDPATERYLRKALKAAYEKGRTRGRSETISGMFAGLNGDGERVLTKALAGLIHKAWSEDDHPRGDDGRFISGEDLSAAKTDPAKAKELRDRVTDPGERKKLEAAIGGGTEAKTPAPAAGAAGEPPQELELAAADAGVGHFPSWAEASFGVGAEARRLGVDPARAATDRRTAGLAAAVHRYRAGDNYHIARKLRAGEELAPDEREAFEAVQGLASRSELPLDARLFRRVGEGFPAAAVGDVLRDAAPSFVAFRESHARNVKVPGDQRLLVIDAPKGSNALYVNAGEGPEGILPAGARLRVTAVEGDRIHVRYEPAGSADRPRVAAGLTPEQVAAHVEAADLDPTRFTPDDLYALAKQAPAETGARRRMLAELANHEDSVGKKLAAGGEVHPDVLAHYPHLSKPTEPGTPKADDAPAAKPKRAKRPAKKPAGVESAPPAGDTAGVGTPAGESELANAVARDAHARKYSSRVGDPSLAAADLTPEQYAALPTVYRGGAPRAGGHVYVTNDPDLAAAHGPVTAYKLAPGATVYPDPEVDEELRDRGTNRHGHAALFGLRQGSAVVHTSHLLPVTSPK